MAEEEQIGSYKFKYENGNLLYVRRREGDAEVAVEIRPENPEFGKFLTHCAGCSAWDAARPITCLPKGIYLCGGTEPTHRTELIDYLKTTGHVLAVEQGLNGGMQLISDVASIGHFGPIQYTHYNIVAKDAPPIEFTPLPIASASTSKPFEGNGLEAKLIAVFLSQTLRENVEVQLRKEEDSDFVRLCSSPVERTFVYVDISRFSSDHPASHQLLIINSLIRIANDDAYWKVTLTGAPEYALGARRDCEASLCIGDGYIFAFKSPSCAAFFAAYVADLIERLIASDRLIEFHFRISVHVGPVYRFWDRFAGGGKEGRWNYIGEGITEGERVLSAIGKDKDDIVYLSASTRKKIRAEREHNSPYNATPWLQNRGRQEDKHKKLRGVYEINHTGWMEAYAPDLGNLPPII